MNGLTRCEVDCKHNTVIVSVNLHALRDERFEVHLDTRRGRIPKHLVAEVFENEVSAKVAVQTGEHVQVEGRRSSCSIIVSIQQHRYGLVFARNQVSTQQQRITRQEL